MRQDRLKNIFRSPANEFGDFMIAKDRWEESSLGSYQFLPAVLREIARNGNLVVGNRPVSLDREETIVKLILENSSVIESLSLGLAGENPPLEKIRHYIPTVGFRPKFGLLGKSLGEIKISDLADLDAGLKNSLFAHLYFFDWMPNLYRRGQTALGILNYRHVFQEYDAKNASLWMQWMLAESLTSSAGKYAVQKLLSFTDQSITRSFESHDSLFAGLAPAFYFLGWRERLKPKLNQLKEYLFSNKPVDAYFILQIAVFLGEAEHRVKALGGVFERVINHDNEGAKDILAELVAREKVTRFTSPLKSWAEESLGISGLIDQKMTEIYEREEEADIRRVENTSIAKSLYFQERRKEINKQTREKTNTALGEILKIVKGQLNARGLRFDKRKEIVVIIKPTPKNVIAEKGFPRKIIVRGGNVVQHRTEGEIHLMGWAVEPEVALKHLGAAVNRDSTAMWEIVDIDVH